MGKNKIKGAFTVRWAAKDGTNGHDGAGLKKINTYARSFTYAQWVAYATEGTSVSWTTTGYDNSHIHRGDQAYLSGTVSNREDKSGNKLTAVLYGTVTAVNSDAVTMTSSHWIMSGETGDPGDPGDPGEPGADAPSVSLTACSFTTSAPANGFGFLINGVNIQRSGSIGLTVVSMRLDQSVRDIRTFDCTSDDSQKEMAGYIASFSSASYIKSNGHTAFMIASFKSSGVNTSLRSALAAIGGAAYGTWSSEQRTLYVVGQTGLQPGQGYEFDSTSQQSAGISVPWIKGVGIVTNAGPTVSGYFSTPSITLKLNRDGEVDGKQDFAVDAYMCIGPQVVTSFDEVQVSTTDVDISVARSGNRFTVSVDDGTTGMDAQNYVTVTLKKGVFQVTLSLPVNAVYKQGLDGLVVRTRVWSQTNNIFRQSILASVYISSYTIASGYPATCKTVMCFSYMKGTVRIVSLRMSSGNSMLYTATNKTFTISEAQENSVIETDMVLPASLKGKTLSVFLELEFVDCVFTSNNSTVSLKAVSKAAGGWDGITFIAMNKVPTDGSSGNSMEYRNDSNLQTSAVRYLDLALIPDNNEYTGYAAYMCKKTHYANRPVNMPGSGSDWQTYWEKTNALNFLSVNVLLAKHAHITFGSGNQLLLMSEDGKVIGGMSGFGSGSGTIRLWIGAEEPTEANFYVTEGGQLHAKNATIEGTIFATAGEFSGWVKTALHSVTEDEMLLYDNVRKYTVYEYRSLLFEDMTYNGLGKCQVILPDNPALVGQHVMIVQGDFPPYTRSTNPYSLDVITTNGVIFAARSGSFGWVSVHDIPKVEKISFIGGSVELLGIPRYSWASGERTLVGCNWLLLSKQSVWTDEDGE